ncbi:hypothetical protein D3C77_659820 [compost metagenome]
MLEHQPDTAKQAVLLPAPDLIEHLLLAAADLLGELSIGPCRQRQAGLQQAAQVHRLQIVQRNAHDGSPNGKPRSMR